MADTTSVPFFQTEAVIAVMRILDERDSMRPLLRLFNRAAHEGEKIKVRKHSRRPGQVRHSAIGSRAMPVRRGTVTEIDFEPTTIKLFDFLTEADIALFSRAQDALDSAAPLPSATASLARARARLIEIATALRDDNAEERHRLCAGAMGGSIAYRMGDDTTDTTVSYSLTSLTAPSTDWDNAAATIVSDVTAWYEEFQDNNSLGLPPTHVFYNPLMYRLYFLANTEWQTWKKQNEERAAGFLGLAGGRREQDYLGVIREPVLGLRWVPIQGTYQNLSDSATTRWATDQLVFTRIDDQQAQAAFDTGGSNGIFEWGMNLRPLSNPNADIHVEIKEPVTGDDVKSWKVTSFDNGLPVIMEPELVQPVDLVA